MAQETKLQIVVEAQNNTKAAFSSVASSLDGLTKSFKTIGTYGAIGFAAVSAELYKAADAAQQSEAIQSQLRAVLTSTGQAAGVTADKAIELSKALEHSTAFSDEQVLSAENMALTFTSIHSEIFPQVTEAALNMATAFNNGVTPTGYEATEMMKLLGKALQDPDAGLGALHRVGVNVDELTEKFKGINDVGTKQQLILQELATEYGGSATAALNTTSGAVKHTQEQLDDMQEEIGNAVIPVVRNLVTALGPVIETITEWVAEHPKLTEVIILGTLALTGLMAILLPISLILPGLVTMFGLLAAGMAAVSLPALAVIAAVTGVITVLTILYQQGYTTKEAWQDVWLGIKLIAADACNAVIDAVQSMINGIINGVNTAINAINKVIAAAQKVPGIGKAIPSIKTINSVDLGGIDTNAITTADLANRGSGGVGQTIINLSGTYLSESVAVQIGDQIMKALKLSNAI